MVQPVRLAEGEQTERESIRHWMALRQGDRQALARLYDSHIAELLSYGYRVTSDRALIKDSIQDVFLQLWNSRERLAETTSVKFYLYRALRNRILRNRTLPEAELDDQAPETDLSFEELWIAEETHDARVNRLRNALAQLPKRQQEAIQLRYFHDFSPDQIAVILGINHQSARNLLHRALLHLQQTLRSILLWFGMTPFFFN